MTFCECGYFASSSVTQTMECPLCGRSILVLSKEDQGRFAWQVMHSEPNPTPQWYETTWMPLVPLHGCLCRWQWRRIEDKRPPDFTSLEAFRLWAIWAHNEVNTELGKPIWQGNTSDAANTLFVTTLDAGS
jgi:hypothetical protein